MAYYFLAFFAVWSGISSRIGAVTTFTIYSAAGAQQYTQNTDSGPGFLFTFRGKEAICCPANPSYENTGTTHKISKIDLVDNILVAVNGIAALLPFERSDSGNFNRYSAFTLTGGVIPNALNADAFNRAIKVEARFPIDHATNTAPIPALIGKKVSDPNIYYLFLRNEDVTRMMGAPVNINISVNIQLQSQDTVGQAGQGVALTWLKFGEFFMLAYETFGPDVPLKNLSDDDPDLDLLTVPPM